MCILILIVVIQSIKLNLHFISLQLLNNQMLQYQSQNHQFSDSFQTTTLGNLTRQQAQHVNDKSQQKQAYLYIQIDDEEQKQKQSGKGFEILIIVILFACFLMVYSELSNSLIVIYEHNQKSDQKTTQSIQNGHKLLQKVQNSSYWQPLSLWLSQWDKTGQKQQINKQIQSEQHQNNSKIVLWSSQSFIWVGGSLDREREHKPLRYLYFQQLQNYNSPFLVHIRRQITIDVSSVRKIQLVSQYKKSEQIDETLKKWYIPHLTIGNFANLKIFAHDQQLHNYSNKIIAKLLSEQKFLDKVKSQLQYIFNKKIFIIKSFNSVYGQLWNTVSFLQKLFTLQNYPFRPNQHTFTIQTRQTNLPQYSTTKHTPLYIFFTDLMRLIGQSIDKRIIINSNVLKQLFQNYEKMLIPRNLEKQLKIQAQKLYDL